MAYDVQRVGSIRGVKLGPVRAVEATVCESFESGQVIADLLLARHRRSR